MEQRDSRQKINLGDGSEEGDKTVQRVFKGLWIPPLLVTAPDLTHGEKFLVAQIENLDSGKGCWASNQYLAKLIQVSIGELKNKLTNLKKKGYLITQWVNGRRYLRIAFDFYSIDGVYVRPEAGNKKFIQSQENLTESGKPDSEGQENLTHSSIKHIKVLKKREYPLESQEVKLSILLLDCILERKPDLKKPNIQTWAGHVDKMIRLDGRDPERMGEVIEWCQKDQFWQDNILSIEKLREQFDKLELKMRKEDKNAGAYSDNPFTQPSLEAYRRLKKAKDREAQDDSKSAPGLP